MNTYTPTPYKYLLLLALLYTSILCTSTFLGYKTIIFWHIQEYGTTILFPITYFFGDVITEVYGYKIARQLIWLSMLCCLITAALATVIVDLPSPYATPTQSAYQIALGPSFRVAIASVLGIIAGAFINSYALSKWKILVKGKYFWLRSISATAIGEGVLTIVSVLVGFIGKASIDNIYQIIIFAYLFKLFYAILATYPASILVSFLKRVEDVDIYDFDTNFSPFKLELTDTR